MEKEKNVYETDDNGIIVSPGKFEGEPIYSPYFWDRVMNGESDHTFYDGDHPVDVFRITYEEKKEFPELYDFTHVLINEDENGFVYCDLFNWQKEIDNMRVFACGICWGCESEITEAGQRSGLCLSCLHYIK